MKPPRYQDAPDEQSTPDIPYSQKKPERFKTARARDEPPGGPAYFRRPVTLGYSNLKRPKR